MFDSIPELKIETIEDEDGTLIMLSQDCGGNVDRVGIHPLHLRHMAEQFGLVPTSDPDTARVIATLERRMLMIRERINYLGGWMAEHSDHKHADLTYEVTHLSATADLIDEFCRDIEERAQKRNSSENGTGTKNGTLFPDLN